MRIKLHVKMLDPRPSVGRHRHAYNEKPPRSQRVVVVELTPDQVDDLKPRFIMVDGGPPVREEIGSCWFEVGHEKEIDA
jgi:hypothetical protein